MTMDIFSKLQHSAISLRAWICTRKIWMILDVQRKAQPFYRRS